MGYCGLNPDLMNNSNWTRLDLTTNDYGSTFYFNKETKEIQFWEDNQPSLRYENFTPKWIEGQQPLDLSQEDEEQLLRDIDLCVRSFMEYGLTSITTI